MKKSVFLILVLGAFAFLAAQTQFIPISLPFSSDDDDDEISFDDEIIAIGLEDFEDAIGAGYLGIYVDDLNFPKAQALKYAKTQGLLITGVVSDSPASSAGLQADDIIMKINDQVIENKEHFIQMRKTNLPGEVLKMTIWRNGAEQPIELTLSERTELSIPTKSQGAGKSHLSVGYGGGSWTPVWMHVDLLDVNDLLKELYFTGMRDKGLLLQGGAGKIHIGKGFFFGLQGASYSDRGMRNKPDPLAKDLSANYKFSTFAFTMDKRFTIKPWLVISLGTGLGTAEHQVELYRDDSDSTWPANHNYQLGYHKAVLKKEFLTVNPRLEVLFPILSWFGMRVEGGYNYGFSPNKGWREEEYNGDTHQLANSPESKFQAFSISAGPWFGF